MSSSKLYRLLVSFASDDGLPTCWISKIYPATDEEDFLDYLLQLSLEEEEVYLDLPALFNLPDVSFSYSKSEKMVYVASQEEQEREEKYALKDILQIMDEVNNGKRQPQKGYYSFHIRQHYPEDEEYTCLDE